MAISNNSIIHYTSKLDVLVKILEEKCFRLKYCSDIIKGSNKGQFEIAVPMVCFCDIPFKEVGKLTDEYGGFGIGMSKEWARKNGLNPVLYCEQNSNVLDFISGIYDTSLRTAENARNLNIFELQKISDNIFDFIEGFFGFIKNYKNGEEQKGKIKPHYSFYDEREWRYVPKLKDIKNKGVKLDIIVDKTKYNKNKKSYNDNAFKFTLPFELSDVTYVVLENKRNVKEFIKRMQITTDFKIEDYIDKIITLEQINEDF